ncbi:LAFE_0E07998g1_1 [Lachancea fermentati]|uniref:LAFE_0E07998g1_1 n=1 Tax=Lachancea fermentati TaxID=4955 RepID=A0A1G4MD57_LACFM|nr:LAFE_0E07998g1_1 [Lachancea fermentati]
MNKTINTRKFARILRDDLFDILNSFTENSMTQILILQKNVLELLNYLCTFSQLINSTEVSQIILCDENCEAKLEELRAQNDLQLIFLVDVKSDLRIPQKIVDIIDSQREDHCKIIYSSWDQEPSDRAGGLQNYIHLQLKNQVKIHPWKFLPVCLVDDNLLDCNFLRNSEGESLYAPKLRSMQEACRSLLIENLSITLQSVLKQADVMITHALSVGPNSHKLVDHLKKSLNGQKSAEDIFIEDALYGNRHSGKQCNLIVLEREIDQLTPMLSQLTYAGILDDLYELRGNKLVEEPSLADVEVGSIDYTRDDVWDELKFQNFGALGPRLNEMARELQVKYDARHQAESVGEIKEFVESLGGLQEQQKLLKLHTALSSKVVSEVTGPEEDDEESLFNRIMELEQDLILGNLGHRAGCDRILELLHEFEAPRHVVLRLCCIFSLSKNGIREREFQILKTELIDSWGTAVLFELEDLTRAGVFLSKANYAKYSKWHDFQSLASALSLVPQLEGDDGPGKPLDANFAYCGVVPITTRIVQMLYDRCVASKSYSPQQPFIMSRTPTWRGMEELFNLQYGAGSIREQVWDRSQAAKTKIIGVPDASAADPVFVVFIGGATLGEVATLQYLGRQLRSKGVHKRFIILCDGIVGGKRVVA